MARPITWLPRLRAIRQSVRSSVRSHYDSSDLQLLFEVQPRSAQLLLAQLPTVRIGKSLLVEQEALAAFLDELDSAADPAAAFAASRRRERPPAVRRKLRTLVQKDVEVNGLPANVELQPGLLTLRFTTVDELAGSLMTLAQIMQDDLDQFARSYEPAVGARDENQEGVDAERADAELFRNWQP